MNTKSNCDHLIGYTERERYDCQETDFVFLSFSDLKTAKELKSNGGTFKFCPHCGKNLEGVLESRVQVITDEITIQKEEERLRKEKSEQAFQKRVSEMSQQTKLDQLPEEGHFVVIFHPTNYSLNKNVLISGDKKSILRNCVHSQQNRVNPDPLIVKNIYHVLSEETLKNIMTENGWTVITHGFEKKGENVVTNLSMSSEGTVYITEKKTDSDGDTSTGYDHFSMHRLAEYLKVEIPLTEVTLK